RIMNKEWFNEQLADIDVPKEEVFTAIHRGIALGKDEIKKTKKKFQPKKMAYIATIAASLLFVSGFVFQPVTAVLASVPIIGSIYENFHSEVGKKLESNGMVGKLNEKASDHGIDVTVTSAYYDGNNIGITFKADGKGISENLTSTGPEAGYSIQQFNGAKQKQWSSTREPLLKKGEEYIGAMTLEYPLKTLPSKINLPLTFTYMGGKKGNWSFHVPVQQILAEEITSNAKTSSQDGAYSLKMQSVIKGKATTIMNYQTKVIDESDTLSIRVYDDHGEKLNLEHVDQERATFKSEINKKANYLMIYPEFSRSEDETIQSIGVLPRKIVSKRFGYIMNIEKVQKKSQLFIVDYTLKNINTSDVRKDILQNFVDQIKLVKSKDTNGLTGQALFENLKADSILYAKKASVVDEETLHYQSTFPIEGVKGFNENDYSLMVPFGILGLNSHSVKLDPIKVGLKNEK
ncbi:DUF4179 domain-containing protein, partial [Bacillus sp. JJ664]